MSQTTFELEFIGAAKVVTGSSYILTIRREGLSDFKVMVDHGMFQGVDDYERNYEPYTFDPSEVDVLFLTHAHIDHCGRLPRLVNKGFRGEIICTKQTAEIVEPILLDSAKIQGRNFQEEGIEPLYDETDSLETISRLREFDFDQTYNYQGQLSFKLLRAGHILGAASIYIEAGGKSIVFSGDLGRSTQEIVKDFDREAKDADYVVMESLYGDKEHEDVEQSKLELAKAITETVKRNGNVILPVFSVQRSQEMLLITNELKKKGQIPNFVQTYFDSNLAQTVTKIYTSNNYELKEEFSDGASLAKRLFTAKVKAIKGRRDSKEVLKSKGSLILSSSGMVNGGKVMQYVKKMISDKNNLLAIVGFQAEGTVGRELVEGARNIEIDDQVYNVAAEISVFRGFSAHADRNDLLSWLDTYDKSRLKKIFLVHAEPEQSLPFQQRLEESAYDSVIPSIGDKFTL